MPFLLCLSVSGQDTFTSYGILTFMVSLVPPSKILCDNKEEMLQFPVQAL